ncbi:hypothetical protein [Cupriavidus pinatubonensis]|uniref:Transcriptional regulator n=1 Tax=Cupriavidus pinatubonensis TaxID=248026 RepID=A0ABM8XKE9_9BURK|nr:hypothetical protein [Cupriavidus pinatubonensis]CAG9180670.1 hypothetical protein LMG23994_04473 [Cupriavidus pinatubonensis]
MFRQAPDVQTEPSIELACCPVMEAELGERHLSSKPGDHFANRSSSL